jgi:hypothetical protein
MSQRGRLGYHIDRVIPHDCFSGITPKKKDRLILAGFTVNEHGTRTKDTASIELKVKERDSVLSKCQIILDENRDDMVVSPQRETTYLDELPQSLTHNAILDLNTVLRDQPIHDDLVHEAKKFLGIEPFLIEESLRDGNDRNNGVLFAAGERGYYWIQGIKQGRFMVNVIVDTIEWNNFRHLTHQWQFESPTIHATYSLTKGGKHVTRKYQWGPPIDEETAKYPWLLEPLNGPWIMADIIHKYSGKSFYH